MPPDADVARRAHALFTRAMELEPELRREFVERETGSDTSVRERVLGLLVAAANAGAFLDQPALAVHGGLRTISGWSADGAAEDLPDAVGEYLILGRLGSGGMATVYEAIQQNPRRRVALKVMRRTMTGGEAYQRFRFEAETLAGLQHPGIAQIYEAGVARLGGPSPSPFFAMELIAGAVPITTFAERAGMSVRDRAAMLARVCDAVHHGHQRGVIHRDLKPGNILVGADGRPKVIDFGVARSIDRERRSLTDQSDLRQIIGTLNYMSPEQCDPAAGVDIRADVYSLGAVLYELVTGRLPHDLSRCSIPQAVRTISEEAPPRAGSVRPEISGDLDAILAKAMSKERDNRYSGADALAADLRRFLAHQPIEARRASAFDQALKFARRNRPLVAAIGVAAASLLIGTAVAWRMAYVANRSRDLAEARERELEVVAAFQESLLSDIDVRAMGEQLREAITQSLERAGKGELDDAPDDAREWLRMSADVNFTAVAIGSFRAGVLERYRIGIEERFCDQPLLRARLNHQFAMTTNALGLHADGEAPLRDALAARRELLGPDHADTLRSAGALASLLSRLGRYDEALALATDTHDRFIRLRGPDDQDRLSASVTLAGVHRRMDNLTEAERLWTEALSTQRRVFGDDHPSTLRTLNNVGVIHAVRGDLRAAEACWRELLERRLRTLGPDHPEYLGSLGNLGLLLQDMGRYEEARPLIEESLAANRRNLGDSHADTLLSMAALASLRRETGDLAGAEVLQRECVEGRLRTLGPEHSQTLLARIALASILFDRGEREAAIVMLRGELEAQRRIIGADHGETLDTIVALAGMLIACSDGAGAMGLMDEALEIGERTLTAENWKLGRIHSVRGAALGAVGRQAEALDELLKGYRLMSGAITEEHPQTRAAAERLVAYYRAAHARDPHAGHDREAERWRAASEATAPAAPSVSETDAPG